MAFNIRKIDPIDIERKKGVGVRLPFSTSNNGSKKYQAPVFTTTYQTKEAIKSNLLNYFLTAKGERYLNPGFGNELLASLFEQYSEERKHLIIDQVKRDLRNYFPKILVRELDLENNENSVQLYLVYEIRDAGTIEELVIDFS